MALCAPMKGRVIRFNAQERLLAKARAYASNAGELVQQSDRAIVLLNQAFKSADEDLKIQIVLMLGALVRPQVVWPLYKLMHDVDESELIRHAAAVQLSVLGGLLPECGPLVSQLVDDLRHQDPFVRANAAFALGWEGNREATDCLIECLDDEDPEVQQAAVNALANLRDERLFGLLAGRISQGAREQKRTILYNLFRFTTRKAEAISIYERFIREGDRDLRYDALMVFQILVEPVRHMALYQDCLTDGDHRVRELALLHLLAAPPAELLRLQDKILAMTRDPQPNVRCAAVRLYHYIQPSTVVVNASRRP
jgi:HEAT repeat protein